MRAFQTFLCLGGLCGQIKQGLGVFPSPPYQCPAAEVSAELSVAVRDEKSHISVKWLKMWLFLAICPPKVSVPVREAGESCGPRHHLFSPNTLCFSYLGESMLQLKKNQVATAGAKVWVGTALLLLPTVGPGSNTQAEGWESSEGVWAPYESADISFSTCSSEPQ